MLNVSIYILLYYITNVNIYSYAPLQYYTTHMAFESLSDFREMGGYDINGVWYPRVTKIVEIKAKPALYKFYGELKSFDEGERIKQQSASEGTLIHETVEALMMKQSPVIPDSIRGAVDAFTKFTEEKHIQIDPSFVEYRLANHTDRYAGTIDAVACIDGVWGVLDIKTSQSIYRDYNLQTAAYMAALEKELPILTTRWILRIDQHQKCAKCGALLRSKGGREKLRVPWQRGLKEAALACQHEWDGMVGDVELKECLDWRHDYEAFLGAKKLWEWENEPILKQIGYLK